MAELQDVLQQMTQILTTLTNQQGSPITVNNATAVPKFKHFDKTVEPWEQYLQRFDQHLQVYNVQATQKKACLLSWVGVDTYQLIMNLCD